MPKQRGATTLARNFVWMCLRSNILARLYPIAKWRKFAGFLPTSLPILKLALYLHMRFCLGLRNKGWLISAITARPSLGKDAQVMHLFCILQILPLLGGFSYPQIFYRIHLVATPV